MGIRKLGAAAVAAGLLVSLAACSSSADPDASGSADSGEKVKLVIWDTGLLGKTQEDGSADLENSFLDQAAALFEEENPNVEIEVVQQGGDITSNGAEFQAASIAGNGPDMRVQYAGGSTLSYADFFMDLSDVFPQETYDSMTGWNTVRADYDPDGALLAMPYGAGSYFTVFYNKEMLEAAGLDPDDHPTTWEELMENGQTILDETGQTPFWVANLEGYVGAWVVGALLGGELGPTVSTDMYTGNVPVDNEKFVKVYQAWADFGASGLVNADAGEVSNGESTAGFVQGKGAYYIVGSWENENMVNEFGDNVGTMFIPMLSGAEYSNTAAGGPNVAVSITNYSKHQTEAAEFLNFLARPEIQDIYVELNQVEASSNKNGDASVITNPLLQEQARQLATVDDIVYPFDNVMPSATIDLFYKLNASVFLGSTTPEDAVKQLSDSYASAITE